MTSKKLLILSFIILSNTLLFAQSNLCTSSSSEGELDLLAELNTIDKCMSEKESSEEVTPKRRYIRPRQRNYYHKLRKSLSAINTKGKKKTAKVIKVKNAYLGEVTEEPVLLSKSKYKGGLKEVLNNYVYDNLVYPSVLKAKGVEGIVWTSFTIDTEGKVKNIVTLGPIGGKLLEAEAAKLIKALPKFTPGKLDGEYVNVKHLMAINFKLSK